MHIHAHTYIYTYIYINTIHTFIHMHSNLIVFIIGDIDQLQIHYQLTLYGT